MTTSVCEIVPNKKKSGVTKQNVPENEQMELSPLSICLLVPDTNKSIMQEHHI